jgi:steroid 5-alpha reductase family enzyme
VIALFLPHCYITNDSAFRQIFLCPAVLLIAVDIGAHSSFYWIMESAHTGFSKDDGVALIGIVAAILVSGCLAWAGSAHGLKISGFSLMAFLVAGVMGVQWLCFLPAYVFKTERFYDLTGSLTYVATVATALWVAGARDLRSFLLVGLVTIWAGRLGLFLFIRILKSGVDTRFDNVRGSFLRFLMAWSLQGMWITFSLAAALAAMTSEIAKPADVWLVVGAAVWLLGFTIESVADAQKKRFRRNPENKDAFISTGLWSWSRHPNYFGEIVLWLGIAIIAFPVLQGWQYVTLSSPLFVALLVTKVSGVPLLEAAADKKWGGSPIYEQYKIQTNVLIPWPPRKA